MRIALLILLFVAGHVHAQIGWTWTELSQMPFRTANNSVTQAVVGNDTYIYSFGGIDTTKLYSGIHQKSFRYNVTTDVWDTIAPLPDTLGKIAGAASTVKNQIYILGGYHVLASGNELSSDKVHRYDPVSNTYLSDGAPIPVPIDDHVQCVWRDSLIFVVTGWSNNGNKPDVQIYDPANDSWQVGTSLPFNNNYIAFGASGQIIGDTIYYHGGTAGSFSFTARNHLRRGIINPNDPTDITWDYLGDNPGDPNYRSACVTHGSRVFWIGGSGIAYNYNGIAYNGSGGVPALDRILFYDSDGPPWYEGTGAPYSVMDLRGVGQVSPTSWIICGGMMGAQEVTDRAFLLEYDPIIAGVNDQKEDDWILSPNPASDVIRFSNLKPVNELEIYSTSGSLVYRTNQLTQNQLDVSFLEAGMYLVRINKTGTRLLQIMAK